MSIAPEPSAADEKMPVPGHGDRSEDAGALQILATEHWSLLATRSLNYTESFSRVSMFLAVLSGSVIALALIAQADRFGPTFVSIAILILAIVLFVGVTTIARLRALNNEDVRCVAGMNRLRRAYLERHPDLEQYFISGSHDDLRSLFQTMGLSTMPGRSFGAAFHGMQTLPGTLIVIESSVAGALVALAAVAIGLPKLVVVLAAAVAFVLSGALLGFWSQRSFGRFASAVDVRFPTPKER
jgi:hypothetical protein